jgi:hypothetical protein
MDFLRHISVGWARMIGWTRAEWAAGLACGLAGVAMLAWAWRLWPEWRMNPELSHGFFAVPVVVMLWIRAREDVRFGLSGVGRLTAAVAAVLLVLA